VITIYIPVKSVEMSVITMRVKSVVTVNSAPLAAVTVWTVTSKPAPVVSAISATRNAPAGTIILNTRLSVQTVTSKQGAAMDASRSIQNQKKIADTALINVMKIHVSDSKIKAFLEIRNILSH